MIITFFKRNVLALAPHYDWFKAGEAFLKQAYHWVRSPLNEYRAATQRKSLTCADKSETCPTITLI